MRGDQRYVVLERGQRSDLDLVTGDKRLSEFDSYEVAVGEAGGGSVGNLPAKAKSTWQLLTQPSDRNFGELAWRVGLAIGGINLVLLGIGLSAANPRRAGSWNLLYALLAFVVYYNMLNLSQAWVASAKLTIGPTLLRLHGGMFVCAVSLLWWRERGLVLALRRAR